MHNSLVDSAYNSARRTVKWVVGATVLLVTALLAERFVVASALDKAALDAQRAYDISGQILLEDERLTMSANMAAATGEARWVERYERHIPLIDKAIADALATASPQAAEQFDNATKVANDRLVEIERSAFAHIAAGNQNAARDLLAGDEYRKYKQVLVEGTGGFVASLRQAGKDHIQKIQYTGQAAILSVLVFAAFCFAALRQALNRSISESSAAHRHAEQRLRIMAMHDELTGLPNRRYFTERMVEAFLDRDKSGNGLVAVAMLDLDHFKDVNDTLGHQAGDELIREITRRIVARLPENAVLARLGGDEFAILFPVADETVGNVKLEAISNLLAQPIEIHGNPLHISASTGVAFYPKNANQENTNQPQEIMRLADIALYRAKAEGRNRVCYFESEMDAQVQSRKLLEGDLRRALEKEQLFLQYQPLMCGDGKSITGVEALLRWQHPVQGLISPAVFVPVAEQSGLIGVIGEWVMRKAFTDAKRWNGITVAINLSPLQFKHPGFLGLVTKLLKETGVNPMHIELEITETLLLEDTDRIQKILEELKSLGFRIALDDFGTGFSSLNYLRRFPFDKIKIDQSYTQGIENSVEAAQIVHSVVGLGRALQMTVTAEGVETGAQHRFLQAAGCHQLQGFLFYRPINVGEIDVLMGQSGTTISNAA